MKRIAPADLPRSLSDPPALEWSVLPEHTRTEVVEALALLFVDVYRELQRNKEERNHERPVCVPRTGRED